MARYPHCDSDVLHSPESGCVYCNMYPEAQSERVRSNINFTGEYDRGKEICPSEKARPLGIINKWYGNVPTTQEMIDEEKVKWQEFNKELKAITDNVPTQIEPKEFTVNNGNPSTQVTFWADGDIEVETDFETRYFCLTPTSEEIKLLKRWAESLGE